MLAGSGGPVGPTDESFGSGFSAKFPSPAALSAS
jgi:hypothetical protein